MRQDEESLSVQYLSNQNCCKFKQDRRGRSPGNSTEQHVHGYSVRPKRVETELNPKMLKLTPLAYTANLASRLTSTL